MRVNKRNQIFRILFFSGVFCITTFFLLNAYELFFSRDVPYIDSVKKVEDQIFLEDIIDRNLEFISESAFMVDGRPITLDYMRIGNSSQIFRMSTLKIDDETGQMLYRPAYANSMFLNDSSLRGSNTKLLVVYIEKSWKMNISSELLSVGNNFFVYTIDGTQYIFKVKSNGVLVESQNLPIRIDEKNNLGLVVFFKEPQSVSYVYAEIISTVIE